MGGLANSEGSVELVIREAYAENRLQCSTKSGSRREIGVRDGWPLAPGRLAPPPVTFEPWAVIVGRSEGSITETGVQP